MKLNNRFSLTNRVKKTKEDNKDSENNELKAMDGSVLFSLIENAIKIPGVKVDRKAFLCERFKGVSDDELQIILRQGPIEAGVEGDKIRRMTNKLINERTALSTGASFAAGLPGGIAMAATIPADILQFYAVALRLAQEEAYLYGAEDLWDGDELDSEKVMNQLVLYCGVMLGATSASQVVRVMSSALAKQSMKKIPQQALTKTFYYPIIKSIAKAFGAKMTKEVFAKGVSKAVPVIGGVVSGGITLFTLRPMGVRLANTLHEASFEYSEEAFDADWEEIVKLNEMGEDNSEIVLKEMESADGKQEKRVHEHKQESVAQSSKQNDIFEQIKDAKELFDSGIISEEEFADIKTKLIAKM